MTLTIITWVDRQGRYRVTSPAYDWLMPTHGWSEDDCINWVWTCIVDHGGYRIGFDHPLYLVEDADQRERLADICGTYFRYAGMPDAKGKRSAIGGAWEMDEDGRPKVNRVKAEQVQRDFIRRACEIEVRSLDVAWMEAFQRWMREESPESKEEVMRIADRQELLRNLPDTWELSGCETLRDLRDAWPCELSVETIQRVSPSFVYLRRESCLDTDPKEILTVSLERERAGKRSSG